MKKKTLEKTEAVELTDGDRMVLAEFDDKQELQARILKECQNYCLDAPTIAGIIEQVKLKIMDEWYGRHCPPNLGG